MITQKQVGEVAAKSGSEKAADGSAETPANVDAVVMADARGLTCRRPSVQAPASGDVEATV